MSESIDRYYRNPYRYDHFIAAMAKERQRFIGPRDALEAILTSVSTANPHAISLVGPHGVGKKFLVRFLSESIPRWWSFKSFLGPQFRDEPFRVIFIKVSFEEYTVGRRWDSESNAKLAKQFIEFLNRRTLDKLNDLHGFYKEFLKDARISAENYRDIIISDTFASDVLDILSSRRDQEGVNVTDLNDLLEEINKKNVRCVFLMDNFDPIAEILDRDAYDNLRSIVTSASMVIVTTKPLVDLVRSDALTSPFFNLVGRIKDNMLNIFLLTKTEAQRLILEPPTWFEENPFRFSQADASFILGQTGTHYDLIRIVCEYLYNWHIQRQSSIDTQPNIIPMEEYTYVSALLQTPVANSLALLWHELSEAERDLLIRTQRLADKLRGESSSDADERSSIAQDPAFSKLVTTGYVTFEEGRYRIFSKLFSDYIRQQFRAQQRNRAPVPANIPGLTDSEEKVYQLLLKHRGNVVSRSDIVSALYQQPNYDKQKRSLDVLISRLRGKIAHESLQIESVRGQGYRLMGTEQRNKGSA